MSILESPERPEGKGQKSLVTRIMPKSPGELVRLINLSLSFRHAFHIVLDFGIELREEPGLHSEAMELAHPLKRPNTYDCHYLALSEIHQCPLWTGDERFYHSVKNSFPQVQWIGHYSLGT